MVKLLVVKSFSPQKICLFYIGPPFTSKKNNFDNAENNNNNNLLISRLKREEEEEEGGVVVEAINSLYYISSALYRELRNIYQKDFPKRDLL